MQDVSLESTHRARGRREAFLKAFQRRNKQWLREVCSTQAPCFILTVTSGMNKVFLLRYQLKVLFLILKKTRNQKNCAMHVSISLLVLSVTDKYLRSNSVNVTLVHFNMPPPPSSFTYNVNQQHPK